MAQFIFGINDAIALAAKVWIFWWISPALAVSLERLEGETAAYQPPPARKPAGSWELPVLWILLSLVSISFVGDYPYIALGIATLGGVYLGMQSILGHGPT